jgi:hypothetical protein
MRKVLVIVVAILVAAMPSSYAASIKGSQDQVLSVSKTTVKSGSTVTVNGKYFDETIGIYLAFCVVPPKGKAPTPCGGGVNKAGSSEASFWISSNPPPYAIGLTEEYLPGGRFTQKVKISKKIGKFDCTKVKCAITVRADHLRSNDRSSDLFIPIIVK